MKRVYSATCKGFAVFDVKMLRAVCWLLTFQTAGLFRFVDKHIQILLGIIGFCKPPHFLTKRS